VKPGYLLPIANLNLLRQVSGHYFVPFGIKDLPGYWTCQILNIHLIKIEIKIELQLKTRAYLALNFLNYHA
jgi:hypothetical protein